LIIHTYPNVWLEAEWMHRQTGPGPLLPGLQLL
jgi:hypothetical protein